MASSDDFDDRDEPRTVVQLTPVKAPPPGGVKQTACLIVLSGATSAGRLFKVAGEMTIGRAEDAEIRLDEAGISRRHAQVRVNEAGEVELLDLGSTNGTFHGGERVTKLVLRDGDKVQVGTTAILKFSYQDELEEAMQKNLYDAATRDGLTRLYNKKFLDEALQKEFAYASRHTVPLSLAVVDADHFKRINDTWGHVAGDLVLSKLAQILKAAVRAEDILARIGGEEFAVVLRETPLDLAVACAERIRQAVERADFVYNGQRLPVTVSVGVATQLAGMTGADELFRKADEQLYAAKQGGRNRVSRAG